MTEHGLITQAREVRLAVLAGVADWHERGGADIYTLAGLVERTTSQTRKHLQRLQRDGLVVRNQAAGPGVRYFLADQTPPRFWLVVADDTGAVLGHIELSARFLDDDGASDRRMRPIGKAIQRILREANG